MENYIKHQDVNFTVTKSTTIEVDGEQREVFPFVLTSERIDRDGDIVVQSDLDISGYENNSVVFFDHDTNKHAVGNAFNLKKKGKKLVGDIWFHELDEESKQLKRYVKAGVYKAGSIGFRVYGARKRATTQQEQKTTNFQYVNELTPTELYEFSIVKIPSNIDSSMIKDYKKMAQMEAEAKQKGLLNKEDNIMSDLVEKAGATLNKANKKKLTDAVELIRGVLDSAGKEEDSEKADDVLTELETSLTNANKEIDSLKKQIEELKPKEIDYEEYNQLIMESNNG